MSSPARSSGESRMGFVNDLLESGQYEVEKRYSGRQGVRVSRIGEFLE